jgi:hypothetical protein
MRIPGITRRRITVAVSVAGVVLAVWGVLLWCGGRMMFRNEAAYNAEMRRLNLDYEIRLREQIDVLLRNQANEPAGREAAGRIFTMLGLSRVAGRRREVESWEKAPHSPERTSVALKWARVAADEAAYEAALCERWAVDYDRGRVPHHITDDEVPPFRMPAGWTQDDLK